MASSDAYRNKTNSQIHSNRAELSFNSILVSSSGRKNPEYSQQAEEDGMLKIGEFYFDYAIVKKHLHRIIIWFDEGDVYLSNKFREFSTRRFSQEESEDYAAALTNHVFNILMLSKIAA